MPDNKEPQFDRDYANPYEPAVPDTSVMWDTETEDWYYSFPHHTLKSFRDWVKCKPSEIFKAADDMVTNGWIVNINLLDASAI